ncbi:amino acid ABC transporter permease [Arthrobacter sp. ISL-85]|uniref:amino acid ABC transporter permease n=1 Tax=Arthrobacter sp. ISL-85 TaxID=2819115 RepID=UPI001BE59670|nr:amino acid ABC transporter permease [Arthrobacter sp. ISL-85]MBT2565106.1 amino acid ABC transporter permease [Arthrobacter sp. ISL-85]
MTAAIYDVAGPRTRRRITYGTVAGALLLAGIAAVAISRLAANGQLSPELWGVLARKDLQTLLFKGLGATLQVALTSLALSLVGGVLLAVGRLSHRPWVRGAARVWVEVFRGLPLLLLIFFVFLGPSAWGIHVPTFWALVISIAVFNSAVIGEILRSGILSLPKGQAEAGYAIGLTRGAAMRLILIPQGVRVVLPSLIAQIVTLLKETSLGFIIGYEELLRNGRIAVEYLGGKYAIPVYTGIALFYLVTNLILSWTARRIQKGKTNRSITAAAPASSEAAKNEVTVDA